MTMTTPPDAGAALRQRFVSTLNGVKPLQWHAEEDPKSCTTADQIIFSMDNRDDVRVAQDIFRDQVGGVPVYFEGPTVESKPVKSTEVRSMLTSFPSVISVSGGDEAEFPNQPGQQSTITVTTADPSTRFFLENVLKPTIQVDGVTAHLKVVAQAT